MAALAVGGLVYKLKASARKAPRPINLLPEQDCGGLESTHETRLAQSMRENPPVTLAIFHNAHKTRKMLSLEWNAGDNFC